LGLPLDVPVAVFLGVLNRYQGVDLLLEVVDLLRQRQVPLHFLVMGFPEEEYRRRAAEMGLAERITFTGRVDYGRTPHLLAAGDLALSPKISRTEANGKLFNYMACGLPTVAFDAPINREILGDAGIYARFGDAGDFADRLVELAADPPCRQELARRVREKAVAEHSWTAREKVLEDLYFRLLESASALGRC
jgi:glycosyltransferase involved in cell wall biosynthesis